MSAISRALARHDVDTAYTLLAERLPPGAAGRALLELIRTVPNWPTAREPERVAYDQRLSPRELQVLRCASQGMSIADTAHELILGIETIKTHRKHAMTKLGAKTMPAAVHLGFELGLLD